jgi:uracil-DNA glycosylase
MKTCDLIQCKDFPCADTDRTGYALPNTEINPSKIKIVMITEAPPANKADYFYARGKPFYLQTTVQAFNDAGFKVNGMQDILDLGVYITTAIKCAKTQYSISPATIKNCSELLKKELSLFPDVKAYLLGGDVAIKAINHIWGKQAGGKVIPTGSTYKIRQQQFYFDSKRFFPSYTPAGKNFLIEKAKRKMVAEDIREAMKLAE